MKKGQEIETRLSDTLTDWQLETYARITDQAVACMCKPGAHTCEGVALTADDRSTGLWAEDLAKCDALGWILRAAVAELNDTSKGTARAIRASSYIGRQVYQLTGRSMIELNDAEGCDVVAAALTAAAQSFRDELESRAVRHTPRYRHAS